MCMRYVYTHILASDPEQLSKDMVIHSSLYVLTKGGNLGRSDLPIAWTVTQSISYGKCMASTQGLLLGKCIYNFLNYHLYVI